MVIKVTKEARRRESYWEAEGNLLPPLLPTHNPLTLTSGKHKLSWCPSLFMPQCSYASHMYTLWLGCSLYQILFELPQSQWLESSLIFLTFMILCKPNSERNSKKLNRSHFTHYKYKSLFKHKIVTTLCVVRTCGRINLETSCCIFREQTCRISSTRQAEPP